MNRIQASFPVAADGLECAAETRTIRGVAVPWGQEGRVADGRKVRFLAGSLDPAGRPVSLRDHDRHRPIGVVVDAADDGTCLRAAVRVSATREGDEALTLAADGVLRALSVGASPTRHRMEGDVLVVEAADWDELSVLVAGAFPGALVTEIAASDPEPDEPEPEPEPDDEPEPAEPEEEQPVPETTTAGAPARIPLRAGPPADEQPLTLHRVAQIYAAAPEGQKGTYVKAALSAITSPGNAGVMQRAYLNEIKGLIEWNRPTINVLSRAPLPPAGMRVEWPVWGTLPTVDVTTGEKVAVPTGTTTVGTGGVDVVEFAGAADISMRLAQRSNPSFMEAYFQGCAEIYARKTNGSALTSLLGVAVAVAPAATFVGSVQAHIASYDPSKVPNGPLFFGMSWDVYSSLVGVTGLNGPAYWTMSIDFGATPFDANATGGPVFYVDRQLPVKTLLSGFRNAATWYEDPASPAEIRVVDVSLLGVDAGVYGYGCLGYNFIGGGVDTFRKTTYTTLPTVEGAEAIEPDTSGWDTTYTAGETVEPVKAGRGK